MKDYREMADSLFARREEYYAERRQRMRTIRGATSGLSLACAALLLGAVIWNSGPADETDTSQDLAPVELQSVPLETGQDPENLPPQGALPESSHSGMAEGQSRPNPIDSLGSAKQESDSSGGIEDAHTALPEKDKATEAEGDSQDQPSSAPVEDVPVAEQSPGHLQSFTAEGSLASCFGGSYTDDYGQFVILLTEDTPQNRSAICAQLGVNEAATRFATASYSLAYLTQLQSAISAGMINKELSFVTVSSLREDINRIHVLVTSESEADLARLKALDTLGGALEIEYAAEGAQIPNLVQPRLE